MAKLLTLILTWLTTHLINSFFKFLFSAVIGFVSYKFIKTLIDRYISATISELSLIGSLSAMVNLSRLDVAISIILSALTIRASIMALGIIVTHKGKS